VDDHRDNLLVFPGGKTAPAPSSKVDIDGLTQVAQTLDGLTDRIAHLRRIIRDKHIVVPTSVLERLEAMEGQADALAKLVEYDALAAQGLIE